MTGSAQAVSDASDVVSVGKKAQQPTITDMGRPDLKTQPRIYDSNTLADITDVQGPLDPRSSAPFPGQIRNSRGSTTRSIR